MLLSSTINAQKCAVFDFSAAKGISVSEVDGISEMFMTYFRPSGYRMVERAQIDKVISEQRYQRSNLTETQMVQMGKIMNASRIVVGKVSRLGGQYQVDVRVVSVETGHDIATEGATFVGDYRTNVKNLAQRLASKISITSSGGTLRKRTSVEIVQGYLKIFPEELGVFDSYPMNVIMQINNQIKYGYNNWRIPTNEELSLIRANGYLSNSEYMTTDNKHGIVLLVSDGKDYETLQEDRQRAEQEELKHFVDLGLPSGTLWKDENEDGGFYTYEQAMAKFGSSLPTKEQFEELKSSCSWNWTGNGYKVVGPNGDSIVLPAAGCRFCGGSVGYVGSRVYYWSSTPVDSDNAWGLSVWGRMGLGVYLNDCCRGQSVRLVH